MKILSDGVAKVAFLISLMGHLVFLSLPLRLKGNSPDLRQKMTVAIELKKPSVLPKIKKMGKKIKIKKVERSNLPKIKKVKKEIKIKKVEHSNLSKIKKVEKEIKVKKVGSSNLPKIEKAKKEIKIKKVEHSNLSKIKKVKKKIKIKGVKSSKIKAESQAVSAPAAETVKTKDLSREAMLRFQDMVKRKIEEARYYPPWAKERHWEGAVKVKFVILPNGRIGKMRILNSSGYRILDKAARRTVNQASPFPPLPKTISFKSVEMEVSIVFTLH